MEKKEHFRREGIELLHVRLSLPEIGVETVDGFYQEIAARAYAFCRDRLFSYAETLYENDPDPRRHIRFSPLCYRLMGCVCYRSETLLSVRIEASLCRGGRETHHRLDAHNFSLPDGLLLSPRDALSQYWGKKVPKKQIKGVSSVLLTDSAPYEKRDGAWVRLEGER